MTFTVELDDDAAIALATVIRRLGPSDLERIANGVDERAWSRAVDAFSLHLPPSQRIRSD